MRLQLVVACLSLLGTDVFAACTPGPNVSCATGTLSVSVTNATALYENGTAIIGSSAPAVNINLTPTPILPSQGATQTYPITVGTFDPLGSVQIVGSDSTGQSGFALKNSTGNTLGFTLQYQDCGPAGQQHTLTPNSTLTLTPAQSSMVVTSGFPSGCAPCHPYASSSCGTGTPGNGAGQLTFTIPTPGDSNQPAGGDYTDTVTLTITALN